MDILQTNEDYIINAYNNLRQDESTSQKNEDIEKPKYDNGYSEEHIRKMKLKKQAKREKKQLKSKQLQGLSSSSVNKNNSHTFLGKHKWLGGAVDPKTGKIYGIPAHSYQIICITPGDGDNLGEISTIPLPNEYQEGKYKWLRGLVYDGYLYGIPAWSVKGILKVKLHSTSESTTRDVKVLPLPREASYYRPKTTYCEQMKNMNEECENGPTNRNFSNIDRGRWMWHGGAVGKFTDDPNSNAAIYCIPSNAQHVLKVYLDDSDKVEEIGPSLSEGQNKWYGGILGADGCIYGMPYTAMGVLRINPKNDKVEVLGNYPSGGYKWHGGLLAKSTGVIYAFPAHSNEVLCVDTNNHSHNDDGLEDQSWRVSTIPIHRHVNDRDDHKLQYKWLGGSYGADGCIYGMPSDATTILRIDPIKNEATTFGIVSEKINKWQGGVLSTVDNCVYAVPADMDCVLRFDTDPDSETYLQIDLVGGGFQDIDDKWQGGFLASDDRIYAIPENINNVMVITPGENPTVKMLR